MTADSLLVRDWPFYIRLTITNVPTLYRSGSTLNITTSKLYILTVVVEKVFTPFTTSQVLVVRVLSPLPNHPSLLNCLAILKIYDPRYLEGREATYSSDGSLLRKERPWTLDKEVFFFFVPFYSIGRSPMPEFTYIDYLRASPNYKRGSTNPREWVCKCDARCAVWQRWPVM